MGVTVLRESGEGLTLPYGRGSEASCLVLSRDRPRALASKGAVGRADAPRLGYAPAEISLRVRQHFLRICAQA
jgi:hypothetical protein